MPEDWARPMVHWEIEAKDAEAMGKFYGELFNWTVGEGRIKNLSPGLGPPDPITGHIRQGETSGVVLYIQVLDLATTLQKTRDLGGQVLREPFQPQGSPTLAWIADPEGNRVVLVQQ
ncbi:MAG: hypothetical protein KC482_18290 [Dehalococcoidia bacterium]|nr:hypothetical protein [Dehalococcoidia bacterium]MCA9825004.1 hypothetical protein [Dehalococcoidia bacterium]MCA9843794.1 hypothetical protein [Dehalococcoidia bacterium]MCA9855506.1 hypothetical protein [Dehalococcoidia bacterium]